MTRQEMDELVNQHFMYEANDDIDGVMSSLSADARHEVIPSPMGELDRRDQIRAYYTMLFPCLREGTVTPVRRLYGDDFIVDESVWHGYCADGKFFNLDGKRGPIDLRLLHIFNLRDGEITQEQVWCDLALVQQELGCTIT